MIDGGGLVSAVVMTCEREERLPLLHRTLRSTLAQQLPRSWRLEVLVLDGPGSVRDNISEFLCDTRVRYLSVPDAGPRGMRLKRNAALELARGELLVFCDDDDWRSNDSLWCQLEALRSEHADVCSVQVGCVCELDVCEQVVRYRTLDDAGSGVFSRHLGNPGTVMLRRSLLAESSSLGFPDTPCEDVDMLSVLTSQTPLPQHLRPRQYRHVLLDRAMTARVRETIGAQSPAGARVDGPTFMTVRQRGFAHEWAAMDVSAVRPSLTPPAWLPRADADLYAAHVARRVPQSRRPAPERAAPKQTGDSLDPELRAAAEARLEQATALHRLHSTLARALPAAVAQPPHHAQPTVAPTGMPRAEDAYVRVRALLAPGQALTRSQAAAALREAHAVLRTLAGLGDAVPGEQLARRALIDRLIGAEVGVHVAALAWLADAATAAAAPTASGAPGRAPDAVARTDDGPATSVAVAVPGTIDALLRVVEASAAILVELCFEHDGAKRAVAQSGGVQSLRAAMAAMCALCRAQGSGATHTPGRGAPATAALLSCTKAMQAVLRTEEGQHFLRAELEAELEADSDGSSPGTPPAGEPSVPPRLGAPLAEALSHPDGRVRAAAAGALRNACLTSDWRLREALRLRGHVTALSSALEAALDAACAHTHSAADEARALAERSACALAAICEVSPAASAAVRARLLPRLAAASAAARGDGSAQPRSGMPLCASASASSRLLRALVRTEARHFTHPHGDPSRARRWPRPSVAYYTGQPPEPWGPGRLESGLGGAETAALQLCAAWAAAGVTVVLYLRAAPGEPACAAGPAGAPWRGVTVVDASHFNLADEFDCLIAWRSAELLELPLRARRILLDLHDMPLPEQLTDARLRALGGAEGNTSGGATGSDGRASEHGGHVGPQARAAARAEPDTTCAFHVPSGAAVVTRSHFHRSALPRRVRSLAHVAVIPNGYDPELAPPRQELGATGVSPESPEGSVDAARPPIAIYASAYDRGLEHMLVHGWPIVCAAVPTAELHVYYGWQAHRALKPGADAYRARLDALLRASTRVVVHGRVGQRDLLTAKARAAVHYYVGDWPEVDCISVRESAAVGCVPVTSTVGVFGDAAKDYCLKVDGDAAARDTQVRAAQLVAELLADPVAQCAARKSVQTQALRDETWAGVALRWLPLLVQT